ncbi:MAG: DNA mismatch repair protein MutS [Deltaproteobacteria bacterium]|nr:DNA mismatch repair protein MutS [Deltaproteobacteria bacterium]
MLKQYLSIKGEYPDAILFFRLGDFYEMFFEDAQIASKILDIALTARNKGEAEPVPLCGVPYHACQPYIAKLLAAGKKVAICEQVEDPKLAKGIVKREVVRVVTPGVVLDEAVLERTAPNYVASVVRENENFYFAALDISTGEFLASQALTLNDCLNELAKLNPKEILWEKEIDFFKTNFPETVFTLVPPSPLVGPACRQAGRGGGEGCQSKAVQLLKNYIAFTQKQAPTHIREVQLYSAKAHLILDEAAQKNLELVKTQDQETKGSLLHLLDATQTPMGGRKLRQWLLYPLTDIAAIRARQEAVRILLDDFLLQQTLQKTFASINDLERIVARISLGSANARDLAALGNSLKVLPALKEALEKKRGLLGDVGALEGFEPLAEKITETLVEDPPFALKEGGLIRAGVNAALDELRQISGSGKSFIATLEEKERQATGISSLKIRFNQVFGYYIEVTHTHREKIPPHYIRKQTLVNAERFITPELKEYEEKVLGAEEKIQKMEYALFLALRDEAKTWGGKIQHAADRIAMLDALLSLASVAQKCRWVCPTLVDENRLSIREGRHPIVEAFSKDRFVPNDIEMDGEKNRFLMITGPNMAGKSTVMRQTALIVVLAQIGSFVPAASAQIGIVDKIFTRVGASDRLSKGESTFMVEMIETANILKEATPKSLVIVDEVGRGTSTYDGVAIAWSVAEYLHTHVKAKTLFATHYHELIELASACEGMQNFNIAVKEWNDKIVFLHKLVPGGTSRSYGVEVAKLAGLPAEVIVRAKEILADWEHFAKRSRADQLSLFTQNKTETPAPDWIKELKATDINRLTPLQALEFLSYLKSKLD